jgi:hypothetical protein
LGYQPDERSAFIRLHPTKYGGANCQWKDTSLVAIYNALQKPTVLAWITGKPGTPQGLDFQQATVDQYLEWIRNGTGNPLSTFVINPIFVVLTALVQVLGMPSHDQDTN